MSRIVGIAQPAGSMVGAALLLKALAAGARPGLPWVAREEALGAAEFGWWGAGDPGLSRGDGVLVAMDGTIYNRAELGEEFPAALVMRLYAEHGFVETLRRLHGDFAIALYDERTRTFWLGRDRLGVKPLYYVRTGERTAFASRPRPLFAVPGVSREPRHEFVALFAGSHYRYFDNDAAGSPYRDVRQVPAGHAIALSPTGTRTMCYWALEDAPAPDVSESELAERYRALVIDAVRRRLHGVTRPAFTLSGGVDSSSVLSAAVEVTGRRQSAFSSVYSDKTYDESEEIRTILTDKVDPWYPITVDTPDVMATVRRMIEANDEPVATATWLSHFVLCETMAGAGFSHVFGGLGGDELNAGEYEYFLFFFADLRTAGREDLLRHEVARWIAHHDHPVFRKSVSAMEEGLARLVDLTRPGRCRADEWRMRRYRRALTRDYTELERFEPVMEAPFRSYLLNRTWQDLSRETMPCCLRAEDRQTAAFGLDHRDPFLDHRLVEFMFRVPATLKIRDGVTKHLLREAMRGVLPEETRTRIKKTGWNAPAHLWFSGPGRAALLDLIDSRAFRERGVYDVAEVRRLLDEHDAAVASADPRENHMMFFWQLVNLELWLDDVGAL